MEKLVEFVKKYRERVVLTGVAISFLFFIGGGILLQNRRNQEKEEPPAGLPEKVELQVKKSSNGAGGGSGSGAGSGSGGDSNSSASSSSSTFLLQPSAGDLVHQMQEMQNLKADVAQKKLQSMRVLWPVYFFGIENGEGGAIASFDIEQDGFGVVVQAVYSPEKFPELEGIKRGRRVWLGGEIVAVDLSGTGRVELNLEYVDFSEGVPGIAVPGEEQKEE